MKQDTVKKKVEKIENSLNRMEQGLYTDVSISWITDQIAWLWKFRHISHDDMVKLTNHAISVMNNLI